jgi:2'-5' RNA ligase
LAGDVEPLGRLQAAVAAAVASVGYPPADDRFHPHVTLGRLKPRREASPSLEPLVAHYRLWAGKAFVANSVVIFASTPSPRGPVYTALATSSLSDSTALDASEPPC